MVNHMGEQWLNHDDSMGFTNNLDWDIEFLGIISGRIHWDIMGIYMNIQGGAPVRNRKVGAPNSNNYGLW